MRIGHLIRCTRDQHWRDCPCQAEPEDAAGELREQIAVVLAERTAYERAGDPLRIADAILALPALRELARLAGGGRR